jgi:hypothetical protein
LFTVIPIEDLRPGEGWLSSVGFIDVTTDDRGQTFLVADATLRDPGCAFHTIDLAIHPSSGDYYARTAGLPDSAAGPAVVHLRSPRAEIVRGDDDSGSYRLGTVVSLPRGKYVAQIRIEKASGPRADSTYEEAAGATTLFEVP